MLLKTQNVATENHLLNPLEATVYCPRIRSPKWVHTVMQKKVGELEGALLQPYTPETRGTCALLNLSLAYHSPHLHQYCGSRLLRPPLPWPESGLSFWEFLTSDGCGCAILKVAADPGWFRKLWSSCRQTGEYSAYCRCVLHCWWPVPWIRSRHHREQKWPTGIWPLDPFSGVWFRIETNHDPWKPAPEKDDRNTCPQTLPPTGQANLFQVFPVFLTECWPPRQVHDQDQKPG